MAGLKVSENREWIVARWLYDFLMQKTVARIPHESRIKERIQHSVTDGTSFALLVDLTAIERKLFYNVVSEVRIEAQAIGPSQFNSPEAFPGFIKQTENLIKLIKEEWPDVSAA
jgi:hypothetical protein